MTPERPRLADHVLARLDRRAGRERLLLFDRQQRRVLTLPARAWSLLVHADGTRELAGLVMAARRLGARVELAEARALLGELAQHGLLVGDAPETLRAGLPEPPPTHGDERVIVEWPQGRYHCDGRGDCCRSYDSITVLPDDVHRAAATLPEDLELAHLQHRVFLPLAGSAPGPAQAIALRDGGCRFLDARGCSLHARGGAEAKPIGCRWFPTRIVDDGAGLRATVFVECVCLATHEPTAAPLLPAGVRRGADLPRGVVVARVPEQVVLREGVTVSRAAACEAIDRLQAQCAAEDDAIARLWVRADAFARHGALRDDDDREPDDPELVAHLAARCSVIARAAAAAWQVERSWRDEHEPPCVRLSAIAQAARLLSSPTAAALVMRSGPVDAALEQRVVAAACFGRTWLCLPEMIEGMREQATLGWLARAVAALMPEHADATLREAPLAAIAATARVHRL